MSAFLPFVVIGLVSGSIYGMAGVGLVLTYKTSGIFNFAFGAVATLAAFVFYSVHVQLGWPWPYALVVAVAIGPVVGVIFESFARTLTRVPMAFQIVATIGILLSLQSAFLLWQGTQLKIFPSYLDTNTYSLLGINVGFDQTTIIAVAVASTIALYVFLRGTRTGRLMLAVVDNPELVSLSGVSEVSVRRQAWIVGMTFATLAGALLGPLTGLTANGLTLLVVEAYGAAAIGYFSNLPLTFAGGLIIGLISGFLTKYTAQVSWLGGVPPGVPFIILVIALLVVKRRRLVVRTGIVIRPRPREWHAPASIRVLFLILAAAFLLAVPAFVGTEQPAWTEWLIFAIAFLSLGLLVKTSGQISLCQMSFMAIGAAAMAHLTSGFGIPWFASLVLSGLIVVPVGALIAIPAIRLSQLFLALATFGFGILLQNILFNTKFMFGESGTGVSVTQPSIANSQTAFYYLVLALFVVSVAVVVCVQRGRLGRIMRALADSPLALTTNGTSVPTVRVVVFCIAAFLAGISGALYGSFVVQVTGNGFPYLQSLTLLALVVLMVGREPWFALMAAGGLILFPAYVHINPYWLGLTFGLGAVNVAITRRPPATPIWIQSALGRLGHRIDSVIRVTRKRPGLLGAETNKSVTVVEMVGLTGGDAFASNEMAGLVVKEVTVSYGGSRALTSASLRVAREGITGLIGPNGAGKTTLFNACSGLLMPDSGQIVLDGLDITKAGPSERARRGLGRTFQSSELWNSLSVRENVSMGFEAWLAGANPLTEMFGRPRDATQIRYATEAAMSICGIDALQDTQVAILSTGQRRLVELARCLAGPYTILLLDEPSSGLDATETKRFGDVLRRVSKELGRGILLVEHDMALVMEVCSYIYVLDFGELIFEGERDAVRGSELVRNVYLGTEVVDRTPADPSRTATNQPIMNQ